VKRTVNFDDPGTYHLYYGVNGGAPGTLMTFFPWPGAPRGRRGSGQATETAFSIPSGSVAWWSRRLEAQRIGFTGPEPRFDGEQVLTLGDPDGMTIELVATTTGDPRGVEPGGPVPAEHAIRGFHSVTLTEAGFERTVALLTGTFGLVARGEARNRYRFAAGDGMPGTRVDLVCAPDVPRGSIAAGSVHHVAWRAHDDAAQRAWREIVAARGFDVTPIVDRQYFKSIYFREPGGVLFEIATDPPGMAIDEPADRLGSSLQLPPWLEPMRANLERTLPHLRPPHAGSVA
jgi:glyoxalase family protein